MFFETERFIVKALEEQDANNCVQLLLHPDVSEYNPATSKMMKSDGGLAYIRCNQKLYDSDKIGMHAIYTKQKNHFVGIVGFHDFLIDELELGIFLLPEFWGKGVAYEVCKPLLALAFKKFMLPHCYARASAENSGSIGLLKKLGLEQIEGDSLSSKSYVIFKKKNLHLKN